MRLTLTIENQTNLPDGGALSFTVTGTRGFDFGRDQYLDWVLPDSSRFISGKHCEVRAQGGEYFLYDVSRNGTFINGSQLRMQSPHRLRSGDRLSVGQYIIAVTVEGTAAQPEGAGLAAETPPPSSGNLWNFTDAAPPIDRRELKAASDPRPAPVDFLDTSADAFAPLPGVSRAPPVPPTAHPPPPSFSDWDAGPVRAAPVAPSPPPIPRPRPQVVEPGTGGVWAAPPAAPPPPALWDDVPVPAAPAVPSPFEPQQAAPPVVAEAMPAAAAPAEPQPATAPVRGAGADDFVRRFATAAGIPPEIIARTPPEELADRLGQLMRLLTAEMMQLLGARSEARRMTRSSSQTVVQALDNNPLKFSPSPEEALAILFGPPTRSYLDAQRAFKAGFADLKSHQVKTYAAMQQAARRLGDDLSPKTIEGSLPAEGGLGAVIGGRRARLWDAYVARWAASAERHDEGLADVFMQYFAECYDRN